MLHERSTWSLQIKLPERSRPLSRQLEWPPRFRRWSPSTRCPPGSIDRIRGDARYAVDDDPKPAKFSSKPFALPLAREEALVAKRPKGAMNSRFSRRSPLSSPQATGGSPRGSLAAGERRVALLDERGHAFLLVLLARQPSRRDGPPSRGSPWSPWSARFDRLLREGEGGGLFDASVAAARGSSPSARPARRRPRRARARAPRAHPRAAP